MIWLTWRQHRLEVALMGLAVALVVGLLVVFGLQLHALFPGGAEACLKADTCGDAWLRMDDDFDFLQKGLTFANLAPLLIGAFLGAPMLTRELESGTWQLAWTQSVTPMRWLAVKLTALGTVTILLAAVLSVAVTWFRVPDDLQGGRFDGDAFDIEGVAPVSYAFFAFAAGAAAGILLRRGLPALAAAAAAYIAVRIPVAFWLRPNYATPDRRTEPIAPGDRGEVVGFRWIETDPQDWVVEAGYADASGHPISLGRYGQLRAAAEQAGADPGTHLNGHGIQRYAIVHPGQRFWTFQLIEAAIYAGLALALVAFVVWRVRRRII